MALLSAYTTDTLMTRDQINALPVPAAIGARHLPISFGDYIETVADQLDRHGLIIQEENHLIGHNGMRYFGVLEIGAKEGELITSDEWRMLVGLRGSHDQSVPRAICAGRSVLVCSNLCFGGDLSTLATKQTLNVWDRLPGMVRQAVESIPAAAAYEEKRIERMRDYNIPDKMGDSMLVELYRRDTLTAAQLGYAVDEWHEPSHPEHESEGYTVWRLEQAVTEAVKPKGRSSNLFTISERTSLASDFFNAFIGM